MPGPPVEVADLVRAAGERFIESSRGWLCGQHLKVLSAISRCRTAELGAHRIRCEDCDHSPPLVYNSCLNRHCPKCQAPTRKRWLEARRKELLGVRYLHLVFTLPRVLSQLALQNKAAIYSLLMRASSQTLLEVARDPRHLGAKIGFFSILHTWNQRLQEHAHVHTVVPAGGLSLDHSRWIDAPSKNFFLPKQVLAEVFRGKFIDGLNKAFAAGELSFYGRFAPLNRKPEFKAFVRTLYRSKWVVEVRPPFGGPGKALEYLSRYTHRVAISNQRLVSFEQGRVTFRWRDSAHGNQQRLLTLALYEFLRPLPAARVAQRLPPHSLLRLSDELQTRRAAGAVPPADRSRQPFAHDLLLGLRTRSQWLGLSSLRRPLAHRRALHRRRTACPRPTCSRCRLMPRPIPAQAALALRRAPDGCAWDRFSDRLVPVQTPLAQPNATLAVPMRPRKRPHPAFSESHSPLVAVLPPSAHPIQTA